MNTLKQQPIGFRVEHLDRVDSTNNYLKTLALSGAPHGLTVVADSQTGGRGRFGRSFESAEGKGLYFSVLLRPEFPPSQAPLLTPWAAVAVCRAVEESTGLSPNIKWINDLLLDEKKLCGILTEADIAPDGSLRHIILGIGLNVSQREEDFSPEVASIATSLAQHLEQPPSREALLTAVLTQLNHMWETFPSAQGQYLEAYRARCSTVGQEVLVTGGGKDREGFALGINENFSLRVRFGDGTCENLDSGMVSARRNGLT